VLSNAAVAVTLAPVAAHAAGAIEDGGFDKRIEQTCEGYSRLPSINSQGESSVYKPRARIDGAGSKSSLISVRMPDPGPLSNNDYVDAMWFRDEFGNVLAANQYRSTGKSYTEPVDGVKGKSIEPSFKARVDAGTGAVYPFIHTAKGFVWEGKAVVVK